MDYIITIPGKPIAKSRPRFARRGKHVMAYNDQETEESRFLFEFQKQWDFKKPLIGPIILKIFFYMKRPKNHLGTGKNSGIIKASKKDLMHVIKPDLSNLIKFVEDTLNGSAWKDDSQIIALQAYKMYSDNPRTKIIITE